MRSPIRLTLILCAALLLSGCRTTSTTTAPHAGRPAAAAPAAAPANLVRTELFFGLGRKGAADVSDREWREFVDQQITPRFPDGLTILDAHGQWRGADGVVQREPSRIVILLHPSTDDAEVRIEQIRSAYRQRFAQESVLRTDMLQNVSF